MKLKRKNIDLVSHGCKLPIDGCSIREILALVDGCWKEPYCRKVKKVAILDESTGRMYRLKVKYELEEV